MSVLPILFQIDYFLLLPTSHLHATSWDGLGFLSPSVLLTPPWTKVSPPPPAEKIFPKRCSSACMSTTLINVLFPAFHNKSSLLREIQ